MICPYCGEIQYTTRKSKNRLLYANLMILLPLPLSLLFDFTSYWLLTVFPVLFMIVLGIYSRLIELSSEEEHLIG